MHKRGVAALEWGVRLADLGSGSFIPSLGGTFTILQTPFHMSDTVVGTFANYDLPMVAGGRGLGWDVAYNSHDVVLEVTSDYNGDGSGTIDAGDYSVWKAQYGQMASPGALVVGRVVPEPASVLLLTRLLCGVILVRVRRDHLRSPRGQRN